MKSKYLFIEAGHEVDETTQPYYVMVGTTSQDNRDLLFLISWSVNHGAYFEPFNQGTADFWSKLLDATPSMRPVILTDARLLVKALKDGTRPQNKQYQLDNQSRMRRFLDTNYLVSGYINRK